MTVAEKDRLLASIQAKGSKASQADLRNWLRQVRGCLASGLQLIQEYSLADSWGARRSES